MGWVQNSEVLSYDDPPSNWESDCELVTLNPKVDDVWYSVMPLTATLGERVAEYLLVSPVDRLKPIVNISNMYKFSSYLTEKYYSSSKKANHFMY